MKRFIFSAIILAGLSAMFSNGTLAETRYDIRAGLNIGGIAPLPLPVEIREISGFNPLLLPAVEFGATTFFNDTRWGFRAAVRIEQKGMRTSARVKNYSMLMEGDDGNSLSGRWTGYVDTHARNTVLTIPFTASLRASDKFDIHFGPFISILLDGQFDGQVYDGYLREGSPVGEKIVFENGATASYDFADKYKRINYGLSLSADCHMTENWLLSLGLDWGLNHVFKDSFRAITFHMYPIFGHLSVGYRF